MQRSSDLIPRENRRFTIAFVLCLVVLGLYFTFYQRPHLAAQHVQEAAQQNAAVDVAVPPKPVDESVAFSLLGTRDAITIKTDRLAGSIALQGLRFDDVSLLRFRDKLDAPQPLRLLSPSGTHNAYFADLGVMPADKTAAMPDANSVWKIIGDNKILTETTPVTVSWTNDKGLEFHRMIAVDDKYMFTVTQTIVNKTAQPVTLYPYALISQSHHVAKRGEKMAFEDRPSSVMHTGAVAYLNGNLEDPSYANLKDGKTFDYQNVNGWLGLTSKYWLVSLIPDE